MKLLEEFASQIQKQLYVLLFALFHFTDGACLTNWWLWEVYYCIFPNNICSLHVFVPQFDNFSTTLVILYFICVIGDLCFWYCICFDGPWSMLRKDGRSPWQVLFVPSQPFPYLLFSYGPVLSEDPINLTAASKGQVNIRVTCLLLQKLEVIKLTGKACQKLRPAEK